MLRFNFVDVKRSFISKILTPDLFFAIFIFVGVFSVFYVQKGYLSQQMAKLNGEIKTLEAEKRQLSSLLREEKVLKKRKRELKKKFSIISQLDKSRQPPTYLNFFADSENIKGVWLNTLSSKKADIVISGFAFNLDYLSEFLEKLSSLGLITFKDARRETYENRELNLKVDYYKFRLKLKRKRWSF